MSVVQQVDALIDFLHPLVSPKAQTTNEMAEEKKEFRALNFSAGPAQLPLEVVKQVQKELLNQGNSGMSVMEMSHRSKWFQEIWDTAMADLRELLFSLSVYF